MRNAMNGDTGSTLFQSAVPLLGVACQRCSHRALLSVEQLEAHANDRRELRRLPLLCRCGSKAVHRVLLETPDDAPAFLAGDRPVPEGQEIGLHSPTF
jgi:hypothetical protein